MPEIIVCIINSKGIAYPVICSWRRPCMEAIRHPHLTIMLTEGNWEMHRTQDSEVLQKVATFPGFLGESPPVKTPPPPRGGGGGYFNMYAYWVCAARETPIFSPEFPFRSISFSQIIKKNPFQSITILNFGADCAVPETIIFKISLISTRSSPPTAGSALRVSGRPERQP